MTNIINLSDRRPKPPLHVDPWQHSQPSLTTLGPREELWSHPYFGIAHLIWATGSNDVPEPPMPPSGGTPVAANVAGYTRMRVAA